MSREMKSGPLKGGGAGSEPEVREGSEAPGSGGFGNGKRGRGQVSRKEGANANGMCPAPRAVAEWLFPGNTGKFYTGK